MDSLEAKHIPNKRNYETRIFNIFMKSKVIYNIAQASHPKAELYSIFT